MLGCVENGRRQIDADGWQVGDVPQELKSTKTSRFYSFSSFISIGTLPSVRQVRPHLSVAAQWCVRFDSVAS